MSDYFHPNENIQYYRYLATDKIKEKFDIFQKDGFNSHTAKLQEIISNI